MPADPSVNADRCSVQAHPNATRLLFTRVVFRVTAVEAIGPALALDGFQPIRDDHRD